MTAQVSRSYRFRTPAQWRECLFDRVELTASDKQGVLRPIAPFEQTAQHYATQGAYAPASTSAGEILWRDDAGFLYRLTARDVGPEACPAPHSIAHASRLVSASNGLWVVGESRTDLQRYEEQTLTRLSSVEIVGAPVIDIASDGYGALFALVEREGVAQAFRVDCSGRIVAIAILNGISRARAFVLLRHSKRFVVLTDDANPRLHWFSDEGGAALASVSVGAIRPYFSASALGSDAHSRAFLAGSDDASLGGKAVVLTFDGDGALLGTIPLDAKDAPASGVTATRDSLLVTGPRGLLRYSVAQTVPDGTSEVRCSMVTPMLYSPEREVRRRWLRIEATASLPEGTTLEICWAATGDAAIRDRMVAIAAERTSPASHRAQLLLREPGIWRAPILFHGSNIPPHGLTVLLTAPLFDVREPYIWVCVTLVATAGASRPALNELAILYPGHTLMENLPAIYRRAEAQPHSFLRSLVGVLETTTQGLDARIAALGSLVHPSTATGPWLDFIARWLGMPWDDALDDGQKRRIIARASDLARGRGTRAGLEALLECLMPGMPPSFRVTDAIADVGFATVGGRGCLGSALPVLLNGRTQWDAELNSNAVLGRMHLPCGGQLNDSARQIAGHIRVDIAASSKERRAWEPWLATLANEMVPFFTRVQIRWVSAQTLRGAYLDGSLTLEGTPRPHLGDDAVIGVARLPDRGNRITSTGTDIGARLQ